MSSRLVLLLVLSVVVACVQAHPRFQQEIPNLPIVNGAQWVGVGHFRSSGGGPRNPFGLDFKAAGFKWTPALCKKDSDGDGFTNGQELGDPDCKWSKGMRSPSPIKGGKISHPGLKESTPSN